MRKLTFIIMGIIVSTLALAYEAFNVTDPETSLDMINFPRGTTEQFCSNNLEAYFKKKGDSGYFSAMYSQVKGKSEVSKESTFEYDKKTDTIIVTVYAIYNVNNKDTNVKYMCGFNRKKYSDYYTKYDFSNADESYKFYNNFEKVEKQIIVQHKELPAK